MKNRYVYLDIYKFIFIILIAVGHFQQYFNISTYDGFKLIISRSYIFVEFFFLISGFMLGEKLRSLNYDYRVNEVFFKRVKSLYPDVLLSTLLCGSVLIFTNTKSLFEVIESFCGELTFTNSLGIDLGRTNAPAWYVSALLCAILILLVFIKILKKFCDIDSIPILLIVVGFLCYGYIESITNAGIGFTLSDHIEKTIFPIGSIRAMAGVSIGIGLNSIYNKYKERISGIKSAALSFIGIAIMFYIYLQKNLFVAYKFQSQMVMVFSYILIIWGALGVYKKQNFIEKYIARYSLTFFLNHYAVAIAIPYFLGNGESNYYKLIPLFIISTIVLSVLMDLIKNKLLNRSKNLFGKK